ncbi:hypothetical protein F2Q69_00006029 [Brassica cretica]|uniref:Uncharacterized protein n=1 Tax=Brassica cretica TaxID=69181 RepID=A0A8S9NXW2_BRACR|nr:hypothetical protein F2Q69_00006029 [Brassica cretica]
MSVHVAPPQETLELQAPPSPRHHQKPRSFPSLTRISGPSSTRHQSDIGDTDHPRVLNSSGAQARHRPLDPRWKEPRFPGSPLEGTRFPVMEFSGPGPRIAPFLREMENF